MYTYFFTTDDIVNICKNSFFEGVMESEKIPADMRLKWVVLVITKHPRVMINTLSIYLYTLIKIIYN